MDSTEKNYFPIISKRQSDPDMLVTFLISTSSLLSLPRKKNKGNYSNAISKLFLNHLYVEYTALSSPPTSRRRHLKGKSS